MRAGQGDPQPLPHLDLQLLLRARLLHAALPALDDGAEAVPGPRDRLAHRRRRPRHAHRGVPRHRRQLPAPRAAGADRRGPGGAIASTPRAGLPRGRATRARGERIDIRDPRVTLVWPSFGDLAAARRGRGDAQAGRAGPSTCRCPTPARRSSRATWPRARSASPRCSCSAASSQFLEQRAAAPAGRGRSSSRALDPRPVPHRPVPRLLRPALRRPGLRERGAARRRATRPPTASSAPRFTRDLWRGVVLSDYFTDVRTAIRLAGARTSRAAWPSSSAPGTTSSTASAAAARALDAALAARRRASSPPSRGRALAGRRQEGPRRRRDLRPPRHLLGPGALRPPRRAGHLPEARRPSPSGSTTPTGRGRHELDAEPGARTAGWRRYGEAGSATRAWLGVESWWKHRVEQQDPRSALMPTGLVPETPHDMDAALEFGGRDLRRARAGERGHDLAGRGRRGDAGRLLGRRHHRAVRLPARAT